MGGYISWFCIVYLHSDPGPDSRRINHNVSDRPVSVSACAGSLPSFPVSQLPIPSGRDIHHVHTHHRTMPPLRSASTSVPGHGKSFKRRGYPLTDLAPRLTAIHIRKQKVHSVVQRSQHSAFQAGFGGSGILSGMFVHRLRTRTETRWP